MNIALWIASVVLLSIGGVLIVIHAGMALTFITTGKYQGSFVPLVGGLLAFVGVMLIPIDLPFNRLLAAYLVMSLDLGCPLGIGAWLVPAVMCARRYQGPSE